MRTADAQLDVLDQLPAGLVVAERVEVEGEPEQSPVAEQQVAV